MPNYKNLPIGPEAPNMVYAVIEIPQGSRNKIEFDPDLECFKLDRVLFSAVHYPTAYGFIPSTLWDDGDPLDVLIITDQILATGLVLDAIPIGGLEMHDDKGHDLKIIAVAAFDPNVNQIKSVSELQNHRRLEIEHFFVTYKMLEDKKVHVGDWIDAEAAREAIGKARVAYEKKQSETLVVE